MGAVPNEDPPPHTMATSMATSPHARGKRERGERYGKSSTAKRLASGLDAWASDGAVSSRAEEDGDGATTLDAGRTSSAPSERGRKRHVCFRYGNYHRYYGYRVGASLEDHRVSHLDARWFEGKRVLDIGCNEGLVSLSVAVNFKPISVIGIDIDPHLVGQAQRKLLKLRRAAAEAARRLEKATAVAAGVHLGTERTSIVDALAGSSSDSVAEVPVGIRADETCTPGRSEIRTASADDKEEVDDYAPGFLRPRVDLADAAPSLGGVTFRHGNILHEANTQNSFDVVLCLSVTKWIQLNWGDVGVKKMFKYVFDSLAPGGVFVLEPQPWKSYRQAFRKQKMPEETRAHYRAITLRPSQYAGWLVGPECGCVFVLALDIHCFPSHD